MPDHIKQENESMRSHGHIRVLDKRGLSYIPKVFRRELQAEKGDALPFFIGARIALVVGRGASPEDVLKGIEILKQDIQLRWRERTSG